MGSKKENFHVMNYDDGWGFVCFYTYGQPTDDPFTFSERDLEINIENKQGNGDVLVLKKNTTGWVIVDEIKIFYYGKCPCCGAYVIKPGSAESFLEIRSGLTPLALDTATPSDNEAALRK